MVRGTKRAARDAGRSRFCALLFRPPYVGHRGWLGIYLDGFVDWNELRTMLEDAYRQVAPRRLRRDLLLDYRSER
jgi:predicted DNA-binding protein (MmcQ/YjbR family)